MGFDVGADAYGRFMGRFSAPLAPLLADAAGVVAGMTALDVGCGPGALTAELVARLGASSVHAVDPSPSFVAAARSALPGVDVRQAMAEVLPFADAAVDAALAQLVVPFLRDPVAGLGEMRRAVRPGGVVAACAWDHAGGRSPLAPFWDAVRAVGLDAVDESGAPGVRAGDLERLARAAGLRDPTPGELTVRVAYASAAEWWEPFGLGVGPAGDLVARLDAATRDRVRAAAVERLPRGAFVLTATAWSVVARA
ncbi:class I SAM-dependent methyltransferase [Cellulomonas endophytica]|uniref:class I SAM-dependent methyltransferase n=1 Tax=Cellulomonas endophytica TaxID=2494735 RepID=UPI001010FF7D|nr:class I SAM-dependent methyltransferase [Cellulomonas endophytica]